MKFEHQRIDRTLQLGPLLQKRSHFLFGARATGKSFLVEMQLSKQAVVIDLLKGDTYLRLSSQPWELVSVSPISQGAVGLFFEGGLRGARRSL